MSVSSNGTAKSSMPPSGEPRHLGTLVCVVLKAKNLPNKRSIGKQDPYCVLQLGTELSKTKPVKRGGQHPTWDEQLHFEIHEDMEEQVRASTSNRDSLSGPSNLSKAAATNAAAASAASSSIASTGRRKPSKNRTLRVACYADDSKEPDFIGEGSVDLTDTLRTGEFDEWVTIKAKDRYAGEVYLELTFYSSAAPPKRRSPLKPSMSANTTYGGAGTFSGDIDEADFDPRVAQRPSYAAQPAGFARAGSAAPHTPVQARPGQPPLPPSISHIKNMSASSTSLPGTPESMQSALRPSSSLTYMDSYTPPYAAASLQRAKSPSVPPPPPPQAPAERRNSFNAPSHIVYQPSAGQAGYHDPAVPLNAGAHQQAYSSGHSQIPSSSSNFTVRPGGPAGIDDLVGGMSSMSVHGSSALPSTYSTPSIPSHQSRLSIASSAQVQPGAGMPHSSTYSHSVDQLGRPLAHATQYASSSRLPQYGDAGPPPMPTPTPPPASHSAPPLAHAPQYPPQSGPPPNVYPGSVQHAPLYDGGTHPASGPPPQHPAHVYASQGPPAPPPRGPSPSPYAPPPQRVASPLPPQPPPRGHTPGIYHALPQPPGQPIASASPAPSAQYQQAPSAYAPPPPAPQYDAYAMPSAPSTTYLQSPYARATSPAPPPRPDRPASAASPRPYEAPPPQPQYMPTHNSRASFSGYGHPHAPPMPTTEHASPKYGAAGGPHNSYDQAHYAPEYQQPAHYQPPAPTFGQAPPPPQQYQHFEAHQHAQYAAASQPGMPASQSQHYAAPPPGPPSYAQPYGAPSPYDRPHSRQSYQPPPPAPGYQSSYYGQAPPPPSHAHAQY